MVLIFGLASTSLGEEGRASGLDAITEMARSRVQSFGCWRGGPTRRARQVQG